MRSAGEPRRARGFSLVELMVGLAVGLVLLAGIGVVFLGARQDFQARQQSGDVEDQARLARFVLDQAVARAGYRSEFDRSAERVFPAVPEAHALGATLPALGAGAFVGGRTESDGAAALRLRFQIRDDVRVCPTNAPPTTPSAAPQLVDMALVAIAPNEAGEGALYCVHIGAGGAITAGADVPLVEHVHRFLVRYGLDSDGDDAVDRHVMMLDATAAQQVRVLRIQLVLASTKPALATAAQRRFVLLDGSVFSANDRFAYQLVDRVVALRSVLP